MLGLSFLVRRAAVLAGPVADAGVLPARYYRHLVLEALEEDDFPGALHHLQWAEDPLLAQIILLRLWLLSTDRQRPEAVQELLQRPRSERAPEQYQALLTEEDRALELLAGYENRALAPGKSILRVRGIGIKAQDYLNKVLRPFLPPPTSSHQGRGSGPCVFSVPGTSILAACLPISLPEWNQTVIIWGGPGCGPGGSGRGGGARGRGAGGGGAWYWPGPLTGPSA